MKNKPIEQRILDELLNGEFKRLKKMYGKVEIRWAEYPYTILELLKLAILKNNVGAWLIKYNPIIYLNKDLKERFRERKEWATLRDCIRHECLHLLLRKPDIDKEFQRRAQKMGIGINDEKLYT